MDINVTKIKNAMRSKKEGVEWVRHMLPHLVSISREIKNVVTAMDKETKALKETIKELEAPYRKDLAKLEEVNASIRAGVLETYKGNEAIKDVEGELIFQKKTNFRILDETKLNRKFLVPNNSAIKEEIKRGAKKIKGVEIFPYRVLLVRPAKSE